MRDSRSDCSVMIPRRRSGRSFPELVGVGPDAGERRLEVVADAAQEVVLGRVELASSWAFCASTCANSWALRTATATWLGEQVEQVLVGALPATRGRQSAERARRGTSLPARRTARSGRDSPGTISWIGMADGSPM